MLPQKVNVGKAIRLIFRRNFSAVFFISAGGNSGGRDAYGAAVAAYDRGGARVNGSGNTESSGGASPNATAAPSSVRAGGRPGP
jgi:hypothetical protein